MGFCLFLAEALFILCCIDPSPFSSIYPPLFLKRVGDNKGMIQSTKNIKPMELIYFEGYKSKRDALIREKRLKQFAKGFSSLKSRLSNFLMLEG